MSRVIVVASFLVLLGGSATAGSLQVFESSRGAPGVTAEYPPGTSLVAHLAYDADSAENGGLLFGSPSDLTFEPTGDLYFSNFTCELVGCSFSFTPGAGGVGSLVVSGGSDAAETGIIDIGQLEFGTIIEIPGDVAAIVITSARYGDGNGGEQTVDPFTVARIVPEPGTGVLLALGITAMAHGRRSRELDPRPSDAAPATR